MLDRQRLGRLPRPLRRRRARAIVSRFSRLFTRLDRHLARTGRKTLGGWVAGGVPVMLLTTIGRHSGRRHTTPVLFHRAPDGTLLVVAVNGAADWNPDWLLNLMIAPRVELEIDGAHAIALAKVLDGDERLSAWPAALHAFPGLERAQAETTRVIPLIRLMIAG